MVAENIKIFDHKIIRCNIPKKIYDNEDLINDIIKIFNREDILKAAAPKESDGKSYSTCGFSNDLILNIKNIDPLLSYISNIIKKYFYKENVEMLRYDDLWMNLTYKNSSGKCHTHMGKNDGTAIFYFNVPENGSKLIILKEDIGSRLVNEKDQSISYNLTVKSGDLVIHSKDVPHAVSKHMSENPRLCLIINFSRFDRKDHHLFLNEAHLVHQMMEKMKHDIYSKL